MPWLDESNFAASLACVRREPSFLWTQWFHLRLTHPDLSCRHDAYTVCFYVSAFVSIISVCGFALFAGQHLLRDTYRRFSPYTHALVRRSTLWSAARPCRSVARRASRRRSIHPNNDVLDAPTVPVQGPKRVVQRTHTLDEAVTGYHLTCRCGPSGVPSYPTSTTGA